MKKCKECDTELTCLNSYSDKRGYLRPYCKECEKEKVARYKQNNLDKVREKDRLFANKNKDKRASYAKLYLSKNRENISIKQKEYWSKPENKERKAKRKREQYASSNIFKITSSCRTRIFKALKGQTKSKTTEKLVGCSFTELKRHLENNFLVGMTWDNYGEWEIDHIIPVSKNGSFHYTNLQPLWWKDNLKKSNNIL